MDFFVLIVFSLPNFLSWALKGGANSKPYGRNKGTNPGRGVEQSDPTLISSVRFLLFLFSQKVFNSVGFLRQAA